MPTWSSAIFAARFAGGKNFSPVRTRLVAGSVMPESSCSAACGASAARAKRLSTSPAVFGLRVGEAEGAPVETGLVGDVVDRRGDVVDRDDVDLATLDAERSAARTAAPAVPAAAA